MQESTSSIMREYPILQFKDEYRFLSNFWPSEVILSPNEKPFPTVEHAYQAAKTFDADERAKIRDAKTAGTAKRIGEVVTLREDWTNQVRISIMRYLLEQKFSIPELREQLLATGDCFLVEGNHWNDTFWGVCNDEGENHLGKLLMELRNKIRITET